LATGEDTWYATGRTLVQALGTATTSTHADFVAGGASAVPALLYLAEALGLPECLQIAQSIGRVLLASARRGYIGWSWPEPHGYARVDLVGLAHGTAGVAVALGELFAATGDGKYRYAVDQALAYEDQFFDITMENWLDLRDDRLVQCGRSDGSVSCENLLAASQTVTDDRRFMSAWCHGAPGIAVARLRLTQLLGEHIGLPRLGEALATTERTLSLYGNADNLCHGRIGNLAVLSYGAQVLCDEARASRARELALAAARERERPNDLWRTDSIDGGRSPLLFTGEAGIGYFYLTQARPLTPSLLYPPSPISVLAKPRAPDAIGYTAALRADVTTRFAANLACETSAGLAAAIQAAEGMLPGQASVGAYHWLMSRSAVGPSVSAQEANAALSERLRFAHRRDHVDHVSLQLRRLAASQSEATSDARPYLVRDGATHFVGHQAASDDARRDDVAAHALWFQRGDVVSTALTALSASILHCAHEPLTFELLVSRVLLDMGIEGVDSEHFGIVESIRSQVDQLRSAGLIRCASTLATAQDWQRAPLTVPLPTRSQDRRDVPQAAG
jgi:hypothetical protein